MYSDYHKPSKEQLRRAVAALNDISEEDVDVLDVDEEEGTKPGENFASVMRAYKVKSVVKGQSLETALMAKLGGKGAPIIHWWEDMRYFERENEFYSKLLPELNKMVEKRSEALPFPRCALTSNEPPMMFMENLKAQGFVMCDARKGWSLEQLELALGHLARFHAAGYHLLQSRGPEACRLEYPEVCEEAFPSLIPMRSGEMRAQAEGMFMIFFRSSVATVKKNLQDPDLLKRFLSYDVTIAAPKSRNPSGDCDVIARGDSWNNNFMFRFDPESGKPLDVRFLDLQECLRARPTLDVATLLATSTTPELRKKHWLSLQEFYYKRLLQDLAVLGYEEDIYSWDRFLTDYKDSFALAQYAAFVNLQTLFNPNIVKAAQSMNTAESMDKANSAMEKAMNEPDDEAAHAELVKRLCALVKEGGQLGLY